MLPPHKVELMNEDESFISFANVCWELHAKMAWGYKGALVAYTSDIVENDLIVFFDMISRDHEHWPGTDFWFRVKEVIISIVAVGSGTVPKTGGGGTRHPMEVARLVAMGRVVVVWDKSKRRAQEVPSYLVKKLVSPAQTLFLCGKNMSPDARRSVRSLVPDLSPTAEIVYSPQHAISETNVNRLYWASGAFWALNEAARYQRLVRTTQQNCHMANWVKIYLRYFYYAASNCRAPSNCRQHQRYTNKNHS